MIDKNKLIECLQDEADFYKGVTDERGAAIRECNLVLIEEINSGRFDIEE
jgi:hypothetical protein